MRLKLTLQRPPGQPHPPVDVLVTLDTTVTVGELAEALGQRDPKAPIRMPKEGVTLAVVDGSAQRSLPHSATVADAGVRSGQTVALVTRGAQAARAEDGVAVLVVDEGPDKGKEFKLSAGANYVGRKSNNTVVLRDAQVSKQHARITVGETIEIVDLGSSNGVVIGDSALPRAVIAPTDLITLGESVVRVVRRGGATTAPSPTVEFNRPPRLDIVWAGVEFEGPEPPKQQDPPKFPLIAMLAPLAMGVVLFAATKSMMTIAFIALSPLMLIGGTIEQKRALKKQLEKETTTFRERLAALDTDLTDAGQKEVASRNIEHHSIAQLAPEATRRGQMLWTMRADRRAFLDIRLGLATLPSRNSVKMPTSRNAGIPELWAELDDVREQHLFVSPVPAVASLREQGALGIAGPRPAALALARSAIAQFTLLHSPAEAVLAGALSSASAADWAWLKWLPHTTSDHSPIETDNVATNPGSLLRLVSEIEDLIASRAEVKEGEVPLPAIVLLVEDDAPIERSRLVSIAERGPQAGVFVIWVAATLAQLPAACDVYADLDPAHPDRGRVGYQRSGEPAVLAQAETLDEQAALELARLLSPIVDSGALVDDASDLPRAVSLVALNGADAADSSENVVERWRESNSLPPAPGAKPVTRKRDNHLRATIGVAAGQNLTLDLREHGPHALVGGTTGSGKSEFLQSWVVAMAAEHSPARLNFLFVDYKGGAAFGECVKLPHAVGMVTDLSPHLVLRALTSFKAELRYREHLLQRKKAKDLLSLERRGDPETPPALVIVVDEFAALAKEMPEFVDGMVDIAQRGRSLGIHLIMATQKPGGVIKDNLRANTNLRVALRVADEDDSTEVVGTKDAAMFDPGIPGRAVVKTGPGRLVPFQAGYVGGHTSDAPPKAIITVEEYRVGERVEWEVPPDQIEADVAPTGPTDLQRLVHAIRGAHQATFTSEGPDGKPVVVYPRVPWKPELAPVYDLARSPQSRTDAELVFGILDVPEDQDQVPVAFYPDRDGNMAVFGTGGTGKSTFLRTLAVAAGLGRNGGPCHVYGLDFGARSLQMLEAFDHVGQVVSGDDEERVQRLLGFLRDTIDERVARYASVRASTIVEYRELAKEPNEARILLLVDGVGTFRDEYETSSNAVWYDVFQAIAAEGRQVGVHVVVSADRPGAISSALSSMIQRRLVLRLASENDFMSLNVKPDVFTADSPAGRGVIDDHDVQVTVLGGTSSVSLQANAIERLAKSIRDDKVMGARPKAGGIGRLVERIALGDLPAELDGRPTIGIGYDTLQPFAFDTTEALLVVGGPQSGRTSVTGSIALAVQRTQAGGLVYLGEGRSELRTLVKWTEEAIGDDAVGDLAYALADRIRAGNADIAVVAIDNLTGFNGAMSEGAVEQLINTCRANGVFVVADAESSSVGSWPLDVAMKAGRHGIVLQPTDGYEGDNIFKTPLPPRLRRNDFPPGRGFYIRSGKTWRVQFALPDVGASQ